MLQERLKGYRLILASGSPRRQQLFKELGLDFEIRLKPIPEEYPDTLKGAQIPEFLARLKADELKDTLKEKEILITSDTVVWHHGESLAKPVGREQAITMLKTLSGDWHEVITAVCFTQKRVQRSVSETTLVKFRKLELREIEFYVDYGHPFDKAGGYGIQEWIGLTGISEIRGSYANVVGLPTHLVYKTLMDMVG
ncbi:MAG: Maf family nucleotide pyrophosphatase [Bacteroidota bacterium]